jgi:hypothetical protein
MSMLLLNAMVAATLACVAAYAQYRIPFYTAGRGRIALTRGVLATVGLLLGYVAAAQATHWPAAMMLFMQGFGIAHVPAALILFFKRARHEGRS